MNSIEYMWLGAPRACAPHADRNEAERLMVEQLDDFNPRSCTLHEHRLTRIGAMWTLVPTGRKLEWEQMGVVS